MSTHHESPRTGPTPVHPGGPPAAPSVRGIRAAAVLVAAGPAAWAIGTAVSADTGAYELSLVEEVTGLAYLAGLAALVWLLFTTRATGPRKGRILPCLQFALLPAAAFFNLYSIFSGTALDQQPGWMMVPDMAWPVGQLLLLGSGIAVAVVGRWRGALRFLPLLCGLWLVLAMGVRAAAGEMAMTYGGAAWLLVFYGALGVLLALRPHDAVR